MDRRKCESCDTECGSDAKFCRNCGNKFPKPSRGEGSDLLSRIQRLEKRLKVKAGADAADDVDDDGDFI
jgi:hypothetical protein